jgi:hypothetical protein
MRPVTSDCLVADMHPAHVCATLRVYFLEALSGGFPQNCGSARKAMRIPALKSMPDFEVDVPKAVEFYCRLVWIIKPGFLGACDV